MRFSHALLVAVLFSSAFATSSAAQVGGPGPRVAGEVLVKFVPGAAAAARADAHRQAGGTVLAEIARTGLQRVAVPGASESAALERYRRNPNVLYAEPNFVRSIPAPVDHAPGSEMVAGDFYFDEQWALRNVGQEFYCLPFLDDELCFYIGTADADIDAPEAWALSMGTPGEIRVAVIDSGIDRTHPELASHYVGGWDFVNGAPDPIDDHGHGTHVSGTIAASVNNLTGTPGAAEGVAGVAPNASLLVYKVCTADGSCNDFAIAQAIALAVADGATVINMSLGGTEYSQAMYDSIQDAWNANVVVVAGAGNDASTQPFYPAAFENVVSVAAFDEDHARASFSNYGNWVDISAPGNVVMSTYPMWACGVSSVPGDTGCYTWMSGTSMATPHVSGAAALVWSRGDVVSNAQVVDILLQSADPRGVNRRRLANWTIHGGLNMHDAMSYGVTNLPPTANAGPDQSVTDTDGDGSVLVDLDGGASSDPDGSIVAYEWREGATVLATTAGASVWLPVGVHTLTLQVTDNVGAVDTDTVVVTVVPDNYAPSASDTSASTVVGTPVVVTLSATDVETCDLVFSLVGLPADGSLGAIGNAGCMSGTPNSDTATVVYTPGTTPGVFTFGYAASDGRASSGVATATVTVDTVPPVGGVTVSAITPASVSRNAGTVTFTISGGGFASGAGVTFANGAGPSPVVLGVTWVSSTEIRATVEIRSGGPRRDRVWDVQVTNPDGASGLGAGLLTITP
jgi:thermitase